MAISHLDKRTLKKEGYFKKAKKANPLEYHKTCKAGDRRYQGPRSEAHHIVPQTSIESSKETWVKAQTGEKAKDIRRYVEDVQYITKWNINDEHNMVGLPTFHSYEQYHQYKDRMDQNATGSAKGKKLIKWFNTKFKEKTRKQWLAEFTKHSPEYNPVHNPVVWGHTEYNKLVDQYLFDNVWNECKFARNNHTLDAKNVRSELRDASDEFLSILIARSPKATMAAWAKRSRTAPKWWDPFTMARVTIDPLYG